MSTLSDFDTNEKWLIRRAAAKHIPINGTLELLPLCNLNCDMCYVHLSGTEMKNGGGLHSAEEWMKVADQMSKSGVLFLLLTGGEPLLFPEFKHLYLELNRKGFILTINTNGTLLDEEWADFFAEYPPRRVNITLYGAGEKSYEKVCHDRNGFPKAIRAIRLLRDRKVKVKINVSAVKGNAGEIKQIYEFGRQMECPVHTDTYMLPGLQDRFQPLEVQSRLNPAQAASTQMEVWKQEMSEEEFQTYITAAIRECDDRDNLYSDGFNCQAGISSFAINWQGQMRPCVSISEPSVPVFDIGFSEAWESIRKEKETIRLNRKCCSCHLRPICQTCVAAAHWETGAYDQVPLYLCQLAEETFKQMKKECERYEK